MALSLDQHSTFPGRPGPVLVVVADGVGIAEAVPGSQVWSAVDWQNHPRSIVAIDAAVTGAGRVPETDTPVPMLIVLVRSATKARAA